MAKQAAIVGAHGVRRTHPDILDRFHAGPGIVDDRKRRDEGDQRHRRYIARPEPQQKQRCVGEARNRRADADQRQQNVLGASRAAHHDADSDAEHRRQREAGDETHDRIESMMRQHTADRQPREGRSDRFQRREKPRRKQASMRDRLPQRADDDERKGVARGAPQRSVRGARSDRKVRNLSDIVHERSVAHPARGFKVVPSRCSVRALC